MTQHLSDIIAEYAIARQARGMKPNTLRNERRSLDLLLSTIGNVQVRHITDRHINQFLATARTRGHGAGQMNIHVATLRPFFEFCRQRRYMPSHQNPIAGLGWFRQVPRSRLRVPAARFPSLLDAAPHPRDRALVAVGLFLFLRQSEAVGIPTSPDSGLRIGDVNLETGEISVAIEKTGQRDIMPISAELDRELRRWLTWYAEHAPRPLTKSDFLLPAKERPQKTGNGQSSFVTVDDTGRPHPDRRMVKSEDGVKRTLLRAGFPIRDANGKATREGMHTLRRSGARALFDRLVEQGYDGAIRTCQAMLHHAGVTTTERYLGLDLDISKRNDLIRGNDLFPSVTDGNIVALPVAGVEATMRAAQ